ncbi:hypothetical protein DAPPUDRAFT_248382 [Daphnia pulex]|uniref:Uncharacterized protein n=1 Tax=Daphnia pulex TaxID=6669 RepID=E9GUJ2_DAPPU|nr:hypothetical protein DAPPUDRAFT_248382 [Daphnia pulex]|eukprot:EFX76730.1 hypothetical protein DAPPUDRAFT_248382 [Daphnia pulex]
MSKPMEPSSYQKPSSVRKLNYGTKQYEKNMNHLLETTHGQYADCLPARKKSQMDTETPTRVQNNCTTIRGSVRH